MSRSDSTSRLDRTRLGTFLGTLIVLAVLFEVVSLATGLGMIQLAPAYMFTPLVAGLFAAWRGGVSRAEIGLRLGRPIWLVVAVVLPPILAYATVAISLLVPGIGFDPGVTLVPGLNLPGGALGTVLSLGLVVVLGATVNAVLALGEEVGWRGYLLWELAPLGFWRASLVIGAIWGVWHAPVIVEGYNYPSFPLVGVAVMTVATVAFSFLYTFLVVRARSVLAAVLFHGVFNAAGGLVLAYTVTDSDALAQLVASPVGAAGIAVYLLVAAFIYVSGTPDLDRSFADR